MLSLQNNKMVPHTTVLFWCVPQVWSYVHRSTNNGNLYYILIVLVAVHHMAKLVLIQADA